MGRLGRGAGWGEGFSFLEIFYLAANSIQF